MTNRRRILESEASQISAGTSPSYSQTVPNKAQNTTRLNKIGGKSVVFNQLVPDYISKTASGDGRISITDGFSSNANSVIFDGKTVVWNQLTDKTKYESNKSTSEITITNRNDGGIDVTVLSTLTSAVRFRFTQSGKMVANNKYFIAVSGENHGNDHWNIVVSDDQYVSIVVAANGLYSAIYAPTNSYQVFSTTFRIGCPAGTYTIYPMLFDLTQMFGSGNEPTQLTDPRVLAIKSYAAIHPEYNAGQLISNDSKWTTTVWNQLIRYDYTSSSTINGVTFTNNGDGTWTVNGTATEKANKRVAYSGGNRSRAGHKVFLCGCPSGGSSGTYMILDAWVELRDYGDGGIFNIYSNGYYGIEIKIAAGTTVDNLIFKPQLFDLTQMFGPGNEPTQLTDPRIAAIRSYAELHPEYNAGTPMGGTVDLIGPNQWDEEWESGYWNVSDGSPVLQNSRIRTKNIVNLLPNTTYYIKGSLRPIFLDSENNYISSPGFITNGTFTTPSNCYGAKFNIPPDYDTTYNHDLSVNYPSTVTTYYPHMVLKSAGTAKDTFDSMTGVWTQNVGVVDLGTLNWVREDRQTLITQRFNTSARIPGMTTTTSAYTKVLCAKYLTNDAPITSGNVDKTIANYNGCVYILDSDSSYTTAADFKSAMSGVLLYYELATPTTTTLPTQPITIQNGLNTLYQSDGSIGSTHATLGYNGTNQTIALDSTHKYLFNDNGTKSIITGVASQAVIGGEDNLTDLTKMYGREVSLEEWNESYGDKYAYDAGSIVSGKCDKVVSKNSNNVVTYTYNLSKLCFNLWDEEWEVGMYDSLGHKEPEPDRIRAKNRIKVLPNTTYYVSPNAAWVQQYDSYGTFIAQSNNVNGLIGTNAYCHYITFYTFRNYGATYNHDICINLSQPDTTISPHNGEYYRHIPGYGWSAGSVYNYVDIAAKKFVKRVGRVDLGTLNWAKNNSYENTFYVPFDLPKGERGFLREFNGMCAKYSMFSQGSWVDADKVIARYTSSVQDTSLYVNDSSYTTAAEFKAAMSGVILYYELATPVETDISDLLPDNALIPVEPSGTVTLHQQNDTKLYLPNETQYLWRRRIEATDFTNATTMHQISIAGLANQYHRVGQQITVNYTATNGTVYSMPWDIVHIGNATLADGTVSPNRIWLQSHYCTLEGMPINPVENFEATESTAVADIYYYGKSGDTVTKLALSTGDAIPYSSYDKVYKSVINDSTGNICKHGYNRYKDGAMDQWLNATTVKGAWYTAPRPYMTTVSESESYNGFLYGLPSDFVNALETVRVTQKLNTVTYPDITIATDTFNRKMFLPSLEQMYVNPQIAGEGSYFDYYKLLAEGNGRVGLYQRSSAYPELISYALENHSSSQYQRLLSTSQGNSHLVWRVDTSGNISNNSAIYALSCRPVCVI